MKLDFRSIEMPACVALVQLLLVCIGIYYPNPLLYLHVTRTEQGKMKSIVVHEDGTELSYLDSGPPSSTNPIYTTIFAVHGIVFSSRSFQVCDISVLS